MSDKDGGAAAEQVVGDAGHVALASVICRTGSTGEGGVEDRAAAVVELVHRSGLGAHVAEHLLVRGNMGAVGVDHRGVAPSIKKIASRCVRIALPMTCCAAMRSRTRVLYELAHGRVHALLNSFDLPVPERISRATSYTSNADRKRVTAPKVEASATVDV